MELTSVLGLGVVAVCIVVLLRQYRPEYALLVSLLCSVLILAAALSVLLPALDEIESMMQEANIDLKYVSILFKSLGLCLITQIASDGCRDAGETAIASRIEFSGRLSLVVIALPMFREAVDIALGFLSM